MAMVPSPKEGKKAFMALQRDLSCLQTNSLDSPKPGSQQEFCPPAPLYLPAASTYPSSSPPLALGQELLQLPTPKPSAAVKPAQSHASCTRPSPLGQEGIYFGASGAGVGAGLTRMLALKPSGFLPMLRPRMLGHCSHVLLG